MSISSNNSTSEGRLRDCLLANYIVSSYAGIGLIAFGIVICFGVISLAEYGLPFVHHPAVTFILAGLLILGGLYFFLRAYFQYRMLIKQINNNE